MNIITQRVGRRSHAWQAVIAGTPCSHIHTQQRYAELCGWQQTLENVHHVSR